MFTAQTVIKYKNLPDLEVITAYINYCNDEYSVRLYHVSLKLFLHQNLPQVSDLWWHLAARNSMYKHFYLNEDKTPNVWTDQNHQLAGRLSL